MEISKLITPAPFLEPKWRPLIQDSALDRRYALEKDYINQTPLQPWGRYKYQPLDTAKQQIRLLKFRMSSFPPTKSGLPDTVQCDMEMYNVDTAPPYIALSYTWGSLQPTRVINVNGQLFHVRENLFDFLATFVDDTTSMNYIWIDQICIDQTSINERNHQVRLMSQIYQRCLFVIAWLGKSSEVDARNFLANRNSATARAILRNRYFTRVWIVQEIVLAPAAYFLCGKVWIPFEKLEAIVNNQEYHQNYRLSPSSCLFVKMINKHPLGLNLDTVLEMFARMDSHDSHDKIYGLLGLVKEDQRPDVDYSKTLHETFLDAVKISLNVFWTNSRLGIENKDGKTQPEPAAVLKLFAFDLARDLDLFQGQPFTLFDFFDKLYAIAVCRAERRERCLLPNVGFSKGYWWCEDEGNRYTFPAIVPPIP